MNKYLLILYFISVPFYFFSSGLPQISELILCIAFLVNFPGIIKVALSKISLIYSPLFLWMVIVNIIHYYISQNLEFITFSFYYVFNWLVITLILYYLNLNRDKIYKSVMWGGYISGIIQIIISFFYSSPGVRESLFFNNPNQLAYFSLLIIITVIFCNDKLKGSLFINYSIMFVGLYLTFISASMGGLVSIIVIIVGYSLFISRDTISRLIAVSVSLVSLVIGYLVFNNAPYLYGINEKLDAAMNRINQSSTSPSNFYIERGYNRILENPEFLVFGAGEGGYERFNANLELHSSLGTVFFSYGIIGILLLIVPFVIIFMKNDFKTIFLLSAPFIYGLSHNGLRDSIFWIFVALLLHLAFQKSKVNEHEIN